MKHSILFFGLALVAAGGLATSARADDITPGSSTVSTSGQSAAMISDNLTRQTISENAAQQAFNANINPLTTVTLAGPYDQEDAFKGANGYTLPGWNVFTGDIQAGD